MPCLPINTQIYIVICMLILRWCPAPRLAFKSVLVNSCITKMGVSYLWRIRLKTSF